MKDFMTAETVALQQDAQSRSIEEMSLPEMWQRWRKGILMAAAAVLLIAPANYGLQLARLHNPLQVFTMFNKALVERRYDDAYDLLDEDTKAAISLANFIEVQRRQRERNGSLQGLDESSVELHRASAVIATLDARLQFDARKVPFHFELRRKRLLWRVYRVREE